MSLKVDLISNADKLEVIEKVLGELRRDRGNKHPAFLALNAVARDLRSRLELPRNNVLGELERRLARVRASHTGLGYETGQMEELARHIIKHWPVIRQALEHFGEISAE